MSNQRPVQLQDPVGIFVLNTLIRIHVQVTDTSFAYLIVEIIIC